MAGDRVVTIDGVATPVLGLEEARRALETCGAMVVERGGERLVLVVGE